MRRTAGIASFILAVTLGGGVWLPAPASANTTVVSVFHIESSDTLDEYCPFSIEESVSGSFKRTDFFDNQGVLTRVVLSPYGGPFTVTWSANGVTATTRSETAVLVFTLDPDGSVHTRTLNGIMFNFVVPGVGTVLMEVGRVVMDGQGEVVFEAGPHQLLTGDVETLCAALSG